ncbi:MAG: hypothetical protein JKY88_09110, partial [Pseudomonadales bacterium]|nr:hypothetical protein [Pseudomonadales bacterium]
PPPTTPSSSPIITTGIVTGFGSVFVNGVEYETGSAEILSDDEITNETDLRVGQVVTLEGNKNDDGVTGTADSIHYNDRVEGPITSIIGNTIIVLGQSILVNGDTVFDDSVNTKSLAGLNVGDVIEVSGFLNSNREIVATYIESNAQGGEFELVGIVENLEINNSTFDLGNQSIDFSNAILQDFEGVSLANGNQVEVKGRNFGPSGELIADRVELEESDFTLDNEVEVEGLISRFESVTDFDVFGVKVTTTSNTVFEGGNPSVLAVNVKVEVEGSIDSNGILVARKVEFRNQQTTRFEGLVDSVDATADRLVVLGITIVTTLTTQFEDDSDLDVIFFSLDDISAGDFVEIRGKLESDGSVTATRLERDDVDNEVSVRGQVQSSDGVSTLVIAGVDVVTNSSTVYRSESDVSLSRADFFAAAQIGVEVEAEGQQTNTSEITAEELELEGDVESSAQGGEFELEGIVKNLDINNSTFNLGNQSIDFSGAIFQDFDGASLADGNQVEVKGRSFGPSGELIADRVELEGSNFTQDDGVEVEVEGPITRFESVTDFDVLGIKVTTTSNTIFEDGNASALAVNVIVEVEGSIDSNGILVARKVEFQNQQTTRFEASVDSVDAATDRLVVLGITIVTTLTTQFEDDSDLDVTFFDLDDISAGDFVELRGKLEDDGSVTATRLERDDMDDEISVRGQVQSSDGASTLAIAGVDVVTNSSTVYRSLSDRRMSRADFFAAAQIGVEVEAEGQRTGNSEITAEELELEGND